jgi:hypothetical protein
MLDVPPVPHPPAKPPPPPRPLSPGTSVAGEKIDPATRDREAEREEEERR